jgi:hypothetical protein
LRPSLRGQADRKKISKVINDITIEGIGGIVSKLPKQTTGFPSKQNDPPALHLLLGFPDGQDEKRLELLKLLGECGLGWNSLPEFFRQNEGSVDKDGPVAHKKLIEWLVKQQFVWSSDLPAILSADWVYKNPTSVNERRTDRTLTCSNSSSRCWKIM